MLRALISTFSYQSIVRCSHETILRMHPVFKENGSIVNLKIIILLSALISIFYLTISYSSLELKKNIVRFSHENIRIFNEFRSIVNMLRALILLTRKCHNIIKYSFNENIKELDYLLISY